MKSIIIEDEKPAAKRLISLLDKNEQYFQIVGILDSIEASVAWFQENQAPDLVFLDIHLADGYSFEIFNQVTISAPIIFTTAYDEYALKAFEVNSIDYLLKPIDEKKLDRSIRKWQAYHQNQLSNQQIDHLIKNFQTPKKYKTRFLIRQPEKLMTVEESQIAYFIASQKLVLLVTHENRVFPVDFTLEDLQDMLDPIKFFRLNRQIIASLYAIENIFNYYHGKLRIELNPPQKEQVFVSREKAQPFKQWLEGDL